MPGRDRRRRSRTAAIAMQPKLVPGCQTPVKDGTVIVADSEKVKAAQKATLEYLLLESSARLPDLRSGGRMLPAGLQLSVRPRLQPAAGAEEHQAGQGPHRRPDHAVHRSLHHVQPLRAVHARDQRHGRAAGHQPRQRTKRSTSSPASRATTSWPATWSTCARSVRCAARIFSTSSACGG